MKLDNSYYENEVREGFFIPGMIKRSWAVQMDVLEQVRRICDKYDIKWFADCGTLLGAVRHHGFIPWDDDLDICMLKEDYDKFLSIVDEELPQDYKVLNIYKEQEYTNFITRIVNHGEINISDDFLKENHGFPYIAGIDVFPLHYLYDDKVQEEDRLNRARKLWELAEDYVNGKINNKNTGEFISEVEKNSKKKFRKDVTMLNAMYLAIDDVFSEADKIGTNNVALMPIYLKAPHHIFPLDLFDYWVDFCFENKTIHIPAQYEKVLEIEYGKNWSIANLKGGFHDYPCYAEQEKDLEEHLHGKLPYKYYIDYNENRSKVKTDSNIQLLNLLKEANSTIEKLNKLGGYDQLNGLLISCQSIAIQLGTSIEKLYGEKGITVVSELEKYCEDIYQMSIKENTEEYDSYICRLEYRLDTIKKAYLKIKNSDIVFLVYKSEDWKKLENFYKTIREKKQQRVLAMPIPYYEKDWKGNLNSEHFETGWISEDIEIVDYREYDFSKGVASIIYTNPFDEYSEAISVHPYFYSTNLSKYADELIYVHIFETKVFKGSEKAEKNAEKYVLSPGVYNASLIIVPSEEERELYINILCKKDGRFNINDCFNKIESIPILRDVKPNDKARKKLMFYVGFSTIYSERQKALEKIESAIKCFALQKDKMEVVWLADSNFKKNLLKMDKYIGEMYSRLINMFNSTESGNYIESDDADILKEIDAYYGTPGFYMNRFVINKIPVMIWNTEV